MIKPILVPRGNEHTHFCIEGDICLNTTSNLFIIDEDIAYYSNRNKYLRPHDTILIDTEAEIDESDGFKYFESNNGLIKQVISNNLLIKTLGKYYKVISSTNKSHNLPDLSNSSKLLFINYYNEHKCMPKSVDVDYQEGFYEGIKDIIVLNQQGEVDITIPEVERRSIKDCVASHEGDTQYKEEKLYTEEELIQKCHLALATGSAYGDKMDQANADSWIDTHIKKK